MINARNAENLTSSNSVSVRKGALSDASALANLRWEWELEKQIQLSIGKEEFAREFISWFQQNERTNIPFICELKGVPIGMAWLALTTRPPLPNFLVRIVGDLQTVYVRPECRRQGFGAKLINAVIDECRSRKLLRLSVNINLDAIAFYQRLGFVRREQDFGLEF